MPEIKHPEPSEHIYALFNSLIETISNELRVCENTPDPSEARYKYDVIINFTNSIEDMTPLIPDNRQRATCEKQIQAINTEIDRLRPTIPHICPQCWKIHPPSNSTEPPSCPNCDPQNTNTHQTNDQ